MKNAKNRVLAIVMLVLACVFATATLITLIFEGFCTYGSIDALMRGEDLGDALGGVFLFIFVIMLGIASGILGLITLPFTIVLFNQVGKKWYSLTLLIYTIAAICLAILMIASVPILGGSSSSADTSSSLSSSASLLLY